MSIKSTKYEELAQIILDEIKNKILPELGLQNYTLWCRENTENKQQRVLRGRISQTDYNIDILAENREDFIIIECKSHEKNETCPDRKPAGISQDTMGGVVFRAIDTGAKGAIIISSKHLQSGAQKIADNIIISQRTGDEITITSINASDKKNSSIKYVNIPIDINEEKYVLQYLNILIAKDTLYFTDSVEETLVSKEGNKK